VLTPRADTLRALGDSAIIIATVTDGRGAALVGASLHWRSSDSSVASVDSAGTIIARAPGRATIEARVKDITASAPVLVRQVPVAIEFGADSSLRMPDGDTAWLRLRVIDARRHLVKGLHATLVSSDSNVVRVDSLGVVAALRPGRATIIAGAADLRATLPVEVVLTPSTIVSPRGDGQRGLAGKPLTEPVVVQVLTRSGQPVPGVSLSLSTEHGEGAVAPATATTDAQGRVRTQWTLGTRAGVQRLFARASVLDSALTVFADADPAPGNARIEVLTTELRGTVAGGTDQPARIRVTDTAGVALASVRVAWSTPDGGTVAGSPQTDSAGYAEAAWTLGRRAASQRLLAQVGNARFTPATTIRAKAEPAAPSIVVLGAGGAQSATAGRPLAKPIILAVRDSLGNGVPGIAVRVIASAGSVSDSVVTSGPDGAATVRWTLGTKAGAQRLELRMGEAARVIVPATARPGTATQVVLAAKKSGTSGAQRVTAQVTDEHGNVIRDAPLAFSAAAGTLNKSRVTSDGEGRAVVTWTPPATAPKAPVRIVATLVGTKRSAELRVR
jgi:hypothetical protein